LISQRVLQLHVAAAAAAAIAAAAVGLTVCCCFIGVYKHCLQSMERLGNVQHYCKDSIGI